MVMEYAPLRRDDGARGYSIRTVYGVLNGDKAGAEAKLDKEARRLCAGDYHRETEEEHPRLMRIGSRPNGEVDLVWAVACKG